jgi:large subunit ribosomal protein L29
MGAHELSDQDLVGKVVQIERDLVVARFKHSTNQLENTASLRVLRKEIARLRTEARAREVAQGLSKDGLFAKYQGTASPTTASDAPAVKGGFLQGIVDKISSNE